MELKKYVLLVESNEIMAVGVDIVKREWQEQGKYYGVMIEKSEMRVIADKWNYPLEKLEYKTSDNILDLVAVGDLIECGRLVYTITDIDKWGNLTLNLGDIIESGNTAITAIYKRQSNGDYKRYEVKA